MFPNDVPRLCSVEGAAGAAAGGSAAGGRAEGVAAVEGGGRGHLERFLPNAEMPRLSKSIQRLYKQNNLNTDRSFQLEKHFVKTARAPRTTKDRGGIRA